MRRAPAAGRKSPGLDGASCACSCALLLCSAAAEGAALGLVSCPGMGLIHGPGEGRGGGGAGMEARLGAGVLEGSCWGGEEGWGVGDERAVGS